MSGGGYGFTCGYCRENLDTPHDDAEPAQAYAQSKGWRYTHGMSPWWGDGAHVTCPNCQTETEDKVAMA